jgi:hypothetical protein
MSGYDTKTGIFELTMTKARFYHRRPVDEALLEQSAHFMDYVAALFRAAGHEVIKVASNYIRVKATQAEVWELLNGQSANPNHPSV